MGCLRSHETRDADDVEANRDANDVELGGISASSVNGPQPAKRSRRRRLPTYRTLRRTLLIVQ